MTLKIKYPINISISDLDNTDVDEMLEDGRFASQVSERILPKIIIDFSKTKETKGYDGFLNNERCEIKTLTEHGLKTCPSSMIGVNRVYSENQHRDAIFQNKYYIITDIVTEKGFFNYYIVQATEKLLFQSMSKKKAVLFLEEQITDTKIYGGSKIKVDF